MFRGVLSFYFLALGNKGVERSREVEIKNQPIKKTTMDDYFISEHVYPDKGEGGSEDEEEREERGVESPREIETEKYQGPAAKRHKGMEPIKLRSNPLTSLDQDMEFSVRFGMDRRSKDIDFSNGLIFRDLTKEDLLDVMNARQAEHFLALLYTIKSELKTYTPEGSISVESYSELAKVIIGGEETSERRRWGVGEITNMNYFDSLLSGCIEYPDECVSEAGEKRLILVFYPPPVSRKLAATVAVPKRIYFDTLAIFTAIAQSIDKPPEANRLSLKSMEQLAIPMRIFSLIFASYVGSILDGSKQCNFPDTICLRLTERFNSHFESIGIPIISEKVQIVCKDNRSVSVNKIVLTFFGDFFTKAMYGGLMEAQSNIIFIEETYEEWISYQYFLMSRKMQLKKHDRAKLNITELTKILDMTEKYISPEATCESFRALTKAVRNQCCAIFTKIGGHLGDDNTKFKVYFNRYYGAPTQDSRLIDFHATSAILTTMSIHIKQEEEWRLRYFYKILCTIIVSGFRSNTILQVVTTLAFLVDKSTVNFLLRIVEIKNKIDEKIALSMKLDHIEEYIMKHANKNDNFICLVIVKAFLIANVLGIYNTIHTDSKVKMDYGKLEKQVRVWGQWLKYDSEREKEDMGYNRLSYIESIYSNIILCQLKKGVLEHDFFANFV